MSDLAEVGFSAENHILIKINASKIYEGGDTRLMLTRIEPSISDLISKHQPQGSH